MLFVHCMIRVSDLQASLDFYGRTLGLQQTRVRHYESDRFSLYFFAAAPGDPEIELTHNWDTSRYEPGNAFGHVAFRVGNIYEACERLMHANVPILRPPRDGHMAFVKDPNGISIELLQQGSSLPSAEPWVSMENQGKW
ncbi:MAG: VOC family protein [Gammaproteobacteria bacterium]|nr:VOC family protein [Gammaproteobacteria bacterium]MBU1408322.1 VOC family protein [Gammaproteobacteria bacterium]MBU1532135.1 VOC family protein [Gammaproteobacteria bacterium]